MSTCFEALTSQLSHTKPSVVHGTCSWGCPGPAVTSPQHQGQHSQGLWLMVARGTEPRAQSATGLCEHLQGAAACWGTGGDASF